jgi:hypothetical protein
MAGPASLIALAEPRNKPTPIVEPNAIRRMWRSRKPRFNESSLVCMLCFSSINAISPRNSLCNARRGFVLALLSDSGRTSNPVQRSTQKAALRYLLRENGFSLKDALSVG